ncbi:4-hydroxythreonine-4-phosphate dehydrogenase PdxA [Variovorax sp. J22G73]|nr:MULTISPECIES: 4-hydroxythreonine-4-phosphate dehydrogenase PdxA [unclassified Variovorax]MDM0009397.1 4-hydroxythreonine-4-phosphate dehydrogenase PdxA [Variovorax sp. J22R203]MDM0101904.1 4-hydroxythreonine-4-phosphate dehydrogenase PdxA [Variovorax sp. J22G73]
MRWSVGHGSATDTAGRGKADPQAVLRAIALLWRGRA